ncbi:MAG: hypothetical protein IK064_02135 [Clostridia bacterium]|nr:hypothetical protein [Clostridia bacterium]MBR6006407.1 hypothetical protein [Clostridia bacterium]
MRTAKKIIAIIIAFLAAAALASGCTGWGANSGSNTPSGTDSEAAQLAVSFAANKYSFKLEDNLELLPPAYVDKYLKDEGITRDELIEILKNRDLALEYAADGLTFVKADAVKVEEMDKSAAKAIGKQYGLNVKAGVNVIVKVTCEKDGERPVEVMAVPVLKIGNKWYISPEMMTLRG